MIRHAPGARRLPARNTVLFLIAIVLPCAVLGGLSVLMMTQQRELAEKRRADGRRALTAAVRSELSSQLERVKLQALTGRRRPDTATGPAGDMVALVAPLDDGRMRLPWEPDGAAPDAARVDSGPFAQALRTGERAEHTPGASGAAIAAFKMALASASSPTQAAAARLALARVFTVAGRTKDAALEDGLLLRTPLAVRDDQATPFALYGAHRRVSSANGAAPDDRAVVEVLDACLSTEPPLGPGALYTLRDVAETAAARAHDEEIRAAGRRLVAQAARLSRDREQAQALQQAVARVLPFAASAPADAPWEFFGPADNRWLVSTAAGGADTAPAIVALRFPAFRSHVEAMSLLRDSGVRVIGGAGTGNGEQLDGALSALSLQIPAPRVDVLEREETLQRRFYIAALLLVVGIAWSGGYFFWQHVQRDLRIADMRSHFVSSVSHELKTPLTSIRMFAETLLMGRSRPEVRDEYLETIVNESERLTRLINNVLDFSKIEQGTKTYRMEPHSLAEIIQSSARVMEYPLLQQGFELRIDVEPGIAAIAVDRDAIQQAILNLLSNAMKYSDESRSIALTLSSSVGEARISVVDRGSGIAAVEHSRIFQKFYRSEAAERQHIPGTGLGLTIVEHVAAAHGGRVALTSAPGHGSTFSLVLPLPPDGSVEQAVNPALGSVHASRSCH